MAATGLAFIAIGCWLAWPPLVWIVTGAVLLLAGVWRYIR